MCASAMFNSSPISSSPIMNFEPPIKCSPSNLHLLSGSPTFSSPSFSSSTFNSSLQSNAHRPIPIGASVNTSDGSPNHPLLSFSPNSSSPPYGMEQFCKSDELRQIEYKKKAKSCMICGDAAFYFFYGSLCCDACRTFFRRSSLQNSKHLKCPFNGKCVINTRTRKDCSKCRLEKCIAVGMNQNAIVNAKEERKRKQSINLYDFPFNVAALNSLNSTPASSSGLYGVSNSFANNSFGFSAIQSEYDQYLQSCLNYANAYYLHNSMNGFNSSLLSSLKSSQGYPARVGDQPSSQQKPFSGGTLDALNQLDTLNSLNHPLNYPSPVNHPFLFQNENSNSNLDVGAFLGHQLTRAAPNLHSHQARSSLLPTGTTSISICTSADSKPPLDGLLPGSGYLSHQLSPAASTGHSLSARLSGSLANQSHLNSQRQSQASRGSANSHRLDDRLAGPRKESASSLALLNKPIESDSEESSGQIRKLSFATSNDDNAKDGFDQRYLNENDFDKIDFNKLDLNQSNLPSFSSSLSPSSSCSSLSSSYASPNNPPSSMNPFDFEQARMLNNYNWKKRKIQYLSDEEIEKENRKVFRTWARQNQLKKQQMEEICKASKRVMKMPDYKMNDCKLNEENAISRSHLLEALRWSFFGITKLCKAFEEISGYKHLSEIEKKHLLMANCTYLLFLSAAKYYNFRTTSWDITVKLKNNKEDKRIKMPVSVEVMNNGSKKELASSYIKFMEIFDRNWLEDELLMTLIYVICLFTPDEKLVKKVNNIKYEHECYLSLLEDYLENKLKCNEKVRSQRNQIKKFLTKLKEFKVEFEAAHVVLEKEETSQLYLHLIEQLSEQLSV